MFESAKCHRRLPLVMCLLLFMPAALSAQKEGSTRRSGESAQAEKKTRTGMASFYGKGLHGKETASGETFDKNELVAAHPTYPMDTRVRVTNLSNGRSQVVRINDRGPTEKNRNKGVIIDVSEQTAMQLGFRKKGKTRVKTEVLEWGEKKGN